MYGLLGRLAAAEALPAGLVSVYTCVLCFAALAADLKFHTVLLFRYQIKLCLSSYKTYQLHMLGESIYLLVAKFLSMYICQKL